MIARPQPKNFVAAGARSVDAQAARGPYTAGSLVASKYRLTNLLGEGGMGAVWAAKNLALEVDVAVKLLRVEIESPEAGARLLREARAAAKLKHSSIVRIYDFGETDYGDPFIVMEILPGGSLADLLDQRVRLDAIQAVRIILPLVSALATAHENGIVHRDLKPGNIVLSSGDDVVVPKIVDFGIAKLKNGEIDGCSTQTGAVLGSPDYMSPEQARGRSDIDERTDIWSLSVVLYEAITGRRPFDATNYNALLSAIIEEVPPPITDFGGGDAELWTILERGLEKCPQDRWSSMRELGGALASWAVARGVQSDSTGASLARTWLGEAEPIGLLESLPPVSAAVPRPVVAELLPASKPPAKTLPKRTFLGTGRALAIPFRVPRWIIVPMSAVVLLVLAYVGIAVYRSWAAVPPEDPPTDTDR